MVDHDSHYKLLFSHKEMVRDLLEGFIQGEWLKQADLDSLEPYTTESVSDQTPATQRHGDMVWRLKIGDNWVYLYLLFEFQSSSDNWMALRLLTYTALLWEKLVKAKDLAPGNTLPPVLPVVLYNGESAWNAPTDLSSLCYPAPTEFTRFQPQAHYLLLEQSKLVAKSEGLRNFAAVLFQLEFSPSPQDFRRVLQELSQWVSKEAPKSLQRSLMAFMLKWLKAKAPGDYPDEMHNFEESIPMLAKRLEQWEIQFKDQGRKEGLEQGLEKGLERGLEQGLEQGLERGLEKGRTEGHEGGLRTALHRLLQNKFGPLSVRHLQIIDEADTPQLEAFLSKILQANSITAVLEV